MNVVAKANENPVSVRFPAPVLKAVTAAAQKSGRSRNTEIVMRLAHSLGLGTGAANAETSGAVSADKPAQES